MKNNVRQKIIFGKQSYGDIKITGTSFGTVTIGNYCSIGQNVAAFMTYDHNIHNISAYPFGHWKMPITKMMKLPLPDSRQYNRRRSFRLKIGNDVWIGSNAILFSEVTIGDGAVIGAYSIITKDIPPYSVAVGHSRIVRKRFPDEDIEFLLKLKWWDFKDQEVADIAPILCSSDFTKLHTWAKENGKNYD